MKNERIVFDVDFGVNISDKNVEKQISQQWDKIKSKIEKGESIDIEYNINPKTAIDDNGNPIDQTTLNKFKKKAEKQVNQVLNNMMRSLGAEMAGQMADAISDKVTNEIKAVFANVSTAIIDSINDMQNNIMSALTGKKIEINTSNIVGVNTESTVHEFEQSSKDMKKASDKFIAEYQKALIELESAKKNEKKAKKTVNADIDVDGFIFNDASIEKIRKSEKETEVKLKELALAFKEASDEFFNIDDFDESQKTQELMASLEKKQKDIANVIMRFYEGNADAIRKANLFGKNNDDYVSDMLNYVDESAQAILENAKEEVSQAKKLVEQYEGDPRFKALSLNESTLNVDKSGIQTKINVEPSINPNKFINKVFNAVKSITDNIKPVEIPIKPNAESVGEFIANVADSLNEGLQKYPIRLALDQENFASQIKHATEGINIDINGSLSGVAIGRKTAVSTEDSDVFDDDEYWDSLMSSSEISNDFMESLKAQMQAASGEANNLEEAIKDTNVDLNTANSNLENTSKKVEKIKQSAKEIADILVGEIDVNEDSELIKLQELIKGYSKFKDLTYVNGIPKSTEQKALEKKENRTDDENKRLEELKEERIARTKIREEWETLYPVIQRVNKAQNDYDVNNSAIQELDNLKNKKNLIWAEKQRLEELSKEEAQRKQNLEIAKRELESAMQALSIAKDTNGFWGSMTDSSLKELSKNYYGITTQNEKESKKDFISRRNKKIKNLNTNAIQNYDSYLNKDIGSEEYAKSYQDSIKKQEGSLKKHLNALNKEADKWNEIINLVEGYGNKDKALEKIQKEIDKINRQLDSNTTGLNIAEQNFKNGVYTPQKISEIRNTSEKEKNELQQQKSLLIEKLKLLKKTNEEELVLETQRNKQRQELLKAGKVQEAESYKSRYELAVDAFNKEISTEEGRNKALSKLRYEDLTSYKQYVDQYNTQKKRKEKKASYDRQLKEEKERLIASGLSEDKAEEKKWDIITDKGDYPKKGYIDKIDKEFKNLELDLNEIFKLIQEINILKDKLADGKISTDQISDIKNQLSKKRITLETLIERTGWNSNDILGYQDFQNLLTQNQNSSNVDKKALDINKFKKDTNSIQQVVDNIQAELTEAEKENNDLIKDVEHLESIVNKAKENITIKHQNDAEKALEKLNKIKEEKEQLIREISNLTDGEEKSAKQQRLGTLNYWEKSATRKYNDSLDPSKIQVEIDRELNNQTQDIQTNINAKKSQILYNEDYIKSLREELELQKEKRRAEEPTSQELTANKRKVNSQYKKDITEINNTINELKSDVTDAQSKLDSISQSAGKELQKINIELEKEIEHLQTLKSQTEKPIKKFEHSSIYQEYLLTQNPIKDKMRQDSKSITEYNKQKEMSQKNINDLIVEYGVETEAQLRKELEHQKVLQSILEIQERINRLTPLANGGIKGAQKDLANFKAQLEELYKQTNLRDIKEIEKSVNSNRNAEQDLLSLDDFANIKHITRKKNKDLINSISRNDTLFNKNQSDYSFKLSQALTEEAKQYNSEFSKSGELTEEVEAHLLNMVRYMDELENISGKEITFSDYGIDMKTYQIMSQILRENQEMDSKIAKSEANYEIKQQRKIEAQERVVASLKEQKREQETLIDSAKRELDIKKEALITAKNQKEKIESQHNADISAIDQKRQLMKERENISKQLSDTSSAIDQLNQVETKLEEVKKQSQETEQAIKEVASIDETSIKNIPKEEFSDTNIIFETDAVKNIDKKVEKLQEEYQVKKSIAQINAQLSKSNLSDIAKDKWNKIAEYNGFEIDSTTGLAIVKIQENAKDAIKETNDALIEQEQQTTITTTLPQSPIIKQQQEIQEEIDKANTKIQEQIALAINNAQVSIADGSYVNIAGDVRIDENQWDGIDRLAASAENLLTIVQNIYSTIATGTVKAVNNINTAQVPIQNITDQVQEVDNALNETNVKLKSFGNNIKAVSTGDIDINSKEFKDIQLAITAMNEALKDNATFKKISTSGDITAKYFNKIEEDADGKEIIKPFLKLNTVFKDTNGQIIKTTYEYDVLNKKISEVSGISAKVSDKFTQQEKAMKLASNQLNYYTEKLDKIKVKYQTFDIDNFGIDDEGNLFAKVGTRAEQIYDIITGKTKNLVKNVILDMQKVNNAFVNLQQQSENGLISQETFKEMSKNLNLMIEQLDNSMNAVNRNMNTGLEHSSRKLLDSWKSELTKEWSYIFNQDNTLRIDMTNKNTTGLQYIQQYKEELQNLKNMYDLLDKQGENFTFNQILQWRQQIQTLTELKKSINANASKQYVNGKGYSLDGVSISSEVFKKMAKDSTYAKQVLSELAKEIAQTDVDVIKLSADNKTLTYSFKDIDKNVQTCKISVDDYGKTIRNTVVESSSHVGLLSRAFGTLKDKLIQITKYVSAYEIFYKFVNAVRSGIEIVKELDTAMTEMKKVSKDSTEALKEFSKESHKIAQEIGSTASTIQNSAADWMRLGYSIKEASGLAKNTSILMNVSEFDDISSATEAMVAMIQAFKTDGKDVITLSEELIDKLNNIGNNYSISTSELAESLQRSSGTLIAANNSIDEAIALTTAGNAIIQDAETTGNALKVISMRIRGTTAKALEDEGEDAEGLIETTSKLEEKIKSLTAVNGKMGVSLLDINGNYRSTYEILQDISDIWEEIGKADVADGQNRQAALLEALAGKTRAQSLASILQNAEMLRSVYEDVQQSEGSAAKENEEWMNSIEAHIQVLTAKWQELWDDSLTRDNINWVIDRLSNIVDLVKNIGLVPSLGGILATILGINKALKGGGRAKTIYDYKSH